MTPLPRGERPGPGAAPLFATRCGIEATRVALMVFTASFMARGLGLRG
jgi:hypothetical protein